jgi:CheY-like chemotaxis protein
MRRRRVLVVEDEKAIAMLLKQIVRGIGADVEVAHDGAEGLAKIRASRPDLLLLDLIMPVMSGEELLTALEQEGLLEGLPVVVISTKETIDGLDQLDLPRLVKPFETAEVRRVVREHLPPDQ